MTIKRWNPKRDANEPDLVVLARALGAAVWLLDQPCDWLLLFCGQFHAVEIKDPAKRGHKGEFTTAQLKFRREVQDKGGQVHVWRTSNDVVDSLNALRSRAVRLASR